MGIRRHIPNAITSLNLACGISGVVAVMYGHMDLAFFLMLGGALADFLDGFSARLLGAYSPMGKELDSQADQVTFGVLPSVMMFFCYRTLGTSVNWLCAVPLLIAVFSGLRLAKFNIDERQSCSFIGLPTPACAILCGSLCYFMSTGETMPGFLSSVWFIPALSAILCALLVCEIPMFSLKFHKGEKIGSPRIILAALVIASAVLVLISGLHWSLIPVFIFTEYILVNIIINILTPACKN